MVARADEHARRKGHLIGEFNFFDDEFGASGNDSTLISRVDRLAVHVDDVVDVLEWMRRKQPFAIVVIEVAEIARLSKLDGSPLMVGIDLMTDIDRDRCMGHTAGEHDKGQGTNGRYQASHKDSDTTAFPYGEKIRRFLNAFSK